MTALPPIATAKAKFRKRSCPLYPQKQTCAVQEPMSALPPIATAKAKFRKRPCLLYPRKRTCAVQLRMSALGQKRISLCMSTNLVLGLLRNWRRRCRSHSSGLDYDFTVLRPAEVWCFGRFRIKRSRGISLEFAFIPLFANTEIKCP